MTEEARKANYIDNLDIVDLHACFNALMTGQMSMRGDVANILNMDVGRRHRGFRSRTVQIFETPSSSYYQPSL